MSEAFTFSCAICLPYTHQTRHIKLLLSILLPSSAFAGRSVRPHNMINAERPGRFKPQCDFIRLTWHAEPLVLEPLSGRYPRSMTRLLWSLCDKLLGVWFEADRQFITSAAIASPPPGMQFNSTGFFCPSTGREPAGRPGTATVPNINGQFGPDRRNLNRCSFTGAHFYISSEHRCMHIVQFVKFISDGCDIVTFT